MPIDTETPTLLCDELKTNKVETDETRTGKLFITGPSAAIKRTFSITLRAKRGTLASYTDLTDIGANLGFSITDIIVNVYDFGKLKVFKIPPIELPHNPNSPSTAVLCQLYAGIKPIGELPWLDNGAGSNTCPVRAEIHLARANNSGGTNDERMAGNVGPWQFFGHHRLFVQGSMFYMEIFFDGFKWWKTDENQLLTIQQDSSAYSTHIGAHDILYFQE